MSKAKDKEEVIYILLLAIWIGGFATINYFYPNSVILWTWACIWFVIIMIYILFFTNLKKKENEI